MACLHKDILLYLDEKSATPNSGVISSWAWHLNFNSLRSHFFELIAKTLLNSGPPSGSVTSSTHLTLHQRLDTTAQSVMKSIMWTLRSSCSVHPFLRPMCSTEGKSASAPAPRHDYRKCCEDAKGTGFVPNSHYAVRNTKPSHMNNSNLIMTESALWISFSQLLPIFCELWVPASYGNRAA